jgi:O-succinylbenzoic acid--CoA ligase
MLVRGMELGMDLYLQQPSSEVEYWSLPKIDFIALVPVQLKYLTQSELGRDFLTNCQVTIVGGAQLDASMEKELDRYPNSIYHTFGMTETASHFALRLLNGPNKQQFYQILPGVEMSQDDRGCLTVKGDITNNKLLTTNDLVSIIDKYTFKWLGRKDQVINTGGYKVHPELLQSSIQQLLDSINIKAKHLVTDLPHPKWGQQVVLLLESQPLTQTTELDLLTLLKQHLKAHEVPKQIKYLDSFPRTDSGKVDILQLKKLLI